MVQNAAAWLLTGPWKREHITPVLSSLHGPPVHFGVHFKILLFVFRWLNGLVPPYLSELLHLHCPSPSLNWPAAHGCAEERRLSGDRAFAIAAPKLWNSLLFLIRQGLFTANLQNSFLRSTSSAWRLTQFVYYSFFILLFHSCLILSCILLMLLFCVVVSILFILCLFVYLFILHTFIL